MERGDVKGSRGVMREGKGGYVMQCFEALEDPRIDRCKRHQLLDIIAIAICAVICGADSWVYVEMFGKSKEEWFRSFPDLPNSIPSHDTPAFARAGSSAMCSPAWTRTGSRSALLSGASRWPSFCPERWWPSTAKRCAAPMTPGQASRPSIWSAPGLRPTPPYRSTGQALTLGQVRTEEKSNEITAIPRLLEMLELGGCIVTIDAMGCQKEIAQRIVDSEADYLLAVKENQGRLYEDVRDLFEGAAEAGYDGVPHDYATTLNKGHGRIERRECWSINAPACLEYLRGRAGMAQLALGAQGSGPPGDGHGRHRATEILHKQS